MLQAHLRRALWKGGGGAAAATPLEATAADSSADAATDAPGGPGATGDEAAAAPAVTSPAKADAGATVATTAEAEAPPARGGIAHCGSNAVPEVASTIEGLIVNQGGAKKALRRFVASFDASAIEHGELGTCVPCRSYRNLKCFSSLPRCSSNLTGR